MTTNYDRPELMAQLTEGIAQLTTSDRWTRFLDYQSRFHSYSFGNVLLIAAQCPEATRVAGFCTWQSVARFVRKGEKAIFIVAPMIYKSPDRIDGEEERILRGFKWVAVFDVAQTDGEEPPSVCRRLIGDDPRGLFGELTAFARTSGYVVEDVGLASGTNGDCDFALRRIRVEVTNTPAQRAKTLVHEIAHALLHEGFKDRALAELEAESIAYIVCRSTGLDTSEYSFGYVASWAGTGDEAITGIKASCERIQRTAALILKPLQETDLAVS
jgi:antirestriction protein ArdC